MKFEASPNYLMPESSLAASASMLPSYSSPIGTVTLFHQLTPIDRIL